MISPGVGCLCWPTQVRSFGFPKEGPDASREDDHAPGARSGAGKLSVTMRQTHVGGDKLFVDYAGDTVPVIIDRLTGELRQAQIFVAVMGASSFTYVEATWTQTIGDWIGAHTRALAAIGGVPRLIVPDMPRSPSSRPVCTSRRSTERTLRWRRITAPPCCRPGRDGRVTKPRSKLAC